jgi:predicted esterase
MENANMEGTTVRLEVQEGGCWGSLGQVQLVDDMPASAASTPPSVATSPSSPSVIGHRNQLPRSVKRLLVPTGAEQQQRKLFYLFRHARQDQPNTNLLVLLHGAGDNHVPFDKLGQTMALPQTATLAISARSYQELPFGLGNTWFQEMNYATGQALDEKNPTRQKSLQQAAVQLITVLELIIKEEGYIIPERVFMLGYGAGAALASQVCVLWNERGHSPLGGAVCVAGGAILRNSNTNGMAGKRKATPLLLMVGQKDASFSPKQAEVAKQRYYPECTEIHVEPNKAQGMIQSRNEMQKVMEFFSRRLVRLSKLPSSSSTS